MQGLTVHGITKTYGYTNVLKDVSFDVPLGSVFALVGCNGAGKTTLSQVLSGDLPPTSGTLKVSARHVTGAFPAIARTRPLQTAGDTELLDAVASKLHGIPAHRAAARTALARVGVAGATLTKHVGRLTAWETVRAEVATAIAGNPAILVLDEADARLPADQRPAYWDLANALADDGLAVIAATQDCLGAAEASSHAAVLVRGTLRFHGELARLGRSTSAIAAALAELHDPRRRAAQPPLLEPMSVPSLAAAA